MSDTIAIYEAAAGTILNANGNTADLSTYGADFLDLNFDVTALGGTSPTITVIVEEKAPDGNYYQLFSTTAIAATGPQSEDIGPGAQTNRVFGDTVRLRWTIGGSAGPSATLSISLTGRKFDRSPR